MEITNDQNTQATTTTQQTGTTGIDEGTDAVESSGLAFADFFTSALGRTQADSVNEEELFAALLEQKLGNHSQEAAEHFRNTKTALTQSMTRSDGYVPTEDIANAALRSVVAEGLVDEATAANINGIAFAAAQLDDNHTALFDSRGSAHDSTVATSTLSDALSRMEATLRAIEDGEVEVDDRSLDETSNGDGTTTGGSQELDGGGGFLWKPVSEGDGNLVILLPTELRGLLDRVEIHSSLPPTEATKLAEGRFAGDTDNGERPHFRFDQPGEAYGDNIHVVAYTSSGEELTWDIGNGGDRHD